MEAKGRLRDGLKRYPRGRNRAGDGPVDGLVLVHCHWPVPGTLALRLFKPFLSNPGMDRKRAGQTIIAWPISGLLDPNQSGPTLPLRNQRQENGAVR